MTRGQNEVDNLNSSRAKSARFGSGLCAQALTPRSKELELSLINSFMVKVKVVALCIKDGHARTGQGSMELLRIKKTSKKTRTDTISYEYPKPPGPGSRSYPET